MLAMGLARDKWPLSDSQPLQSSKATRNRIIQTNTVKNLSDYNPKADWDGWTKMRFLGSAILKMQVIKGPGVLTPPGSSLGMQILRLPPPKALQNQKLGWCGE